jgi:hypothetical protein
LLYLAIPKPDRFVQIGDGRWPRGLPSDERQSITFMTTAAW